MRRPGRGEESSSDDLPSSNELQPSLFGDVQSQNEQARRIFRDFKARASKNVLSELESGLQELVFKYDVKNRENRFVVGLTAELLIAAAMRASGTDVDNVGATETETDFEIYTERVRSRISVKSSFTEGQGDLRLVNYLGGSEHRAAEMVPTIFVLPGLGMIYGDGGYATLANAIRQTRDASVIPTRAIATHAHEHPELVIPLNVPVNNHTGTKVASREVARSIVNSHGYPSLGKWLRPEPSPRLAAEVREEIARYDKLREEGALTKAEFERAKADLLRLLQSQT